MKPALFSVGRMQIRQATPFVRSKHAPCWQGTKTRSQPQRHQVCATTGPLNLRILEGVKWGTFDGWWLERLQLWGAPISRLFVAQLSAVFSRVWAKRSGRPRKRPFLPPPIPSSSFGCFLAYSPRVFRAGSPGEKTYFGVFENVCLGIFENEQGKGMDGEPTVL